MATKRKGKLPRKAKDVPLSALGAMSQESLRIEEEGRPTERSLAELLELKTFEEALAGKVSSVRAVFKMLAKREIARTKHIPTYPEVLILKEHLDARNAEDALMLLEILEVDPYLSRHHTTRLCSKIQRWAVEAALSRLRKPLNAHDIANIRTTVANSYEIAALSERISDD